MSDQSARKLIQSAQIPSFYPLPVRHELDYIADGWAGATPPEVPTGWELPLRPPLPPLVPDPGSAPELLPLPLEPVGFDA